MMRSLSVALLITLFTGLYCCDAAEAGSNIPVYHFCAPPFQKGQTIDDIRMIYQPMLTWLGKRTGTRFDVVGASSYEDLVQLIAEGKVHLARLGPASYVAARQQNHDIQLLVTELQWTPDKTKLTDSYHSNIVSLKSRGDIKSLQDLKGKIFAFVDRISTSGFVYPNYLLQNKGIMPEKYFGKIYYLGSHPRVTDAVAAGSVDAGAISDYNLAEAKKKYGDVFNTLITSTPIPNNVIVAHPSLPPELRAKIIKLLPSIDPSLLKGLSVAGFIMRTDSFYDEVRRLMEQDKTRQAH